MPAPVNFTINRIREDLTEAYLRVFKDVKDELMRPGYTYGKVCAELEAVFRPFHLISIAPDILNPKFLEYKAYFNKEISELLDAKHPRYAGALRNFDPRLNEAANLAFHFFVHSPSWDMLNEDNQAAFLNWISTAVRCETQENNWILFRGMLGLFHAIKTSSAIPNWVSESFRAVLPWIQKSGWVQDGQGAHVDFYTGFVFYPFLLIGVKHGIFSNSEQKMVFQRLECWSDQIALMTDSRGRVPLFGRSLIYRFAFISPFLLANQLFKISLISNDLLGAIVQNYLTSTITSSGILTLGVFGAKPELAEHYSIRASTYWLARALIPTSLTNGTSNRRKQLEADSLAWPHKIIRGHERTYVININKEFTDSPYFQHIIDSENGMLRLSSYGTFQRLTLRKGRLIWKAVSCELTRNSSDNTDSPHSRLTFSFIQWGIYRIGWNEQVNSHSMHHLARITRTSSLHLQLSQFRFEEYFFLSLKPSTIDVNIS